MKFKRTIYWALGFAVLALAVLYVQMVREMREYKPSLLLSCVDSRQVLTAWTCRQVLLRGSFSPDQVVQLNHEGGALYPVLSEDPALAEEMLSLFIARGVDINAGDERVKRWTALHSVAMEGNPERVRLLMKHGARADVQDSAGMTPLDFARQMHQKHPAEPNRAEVVRLLEDAGTK